MLIKIKKHQGFTLIELMMVLSIIGVLASVAIPSYRSYIYKAQAAEIGIFMGAAKKKFMIEYDATGKIPLEIFSYDDAIATTIDNKKDSFVFNTNPISEAWAITAEQKAKRTEAKAKRLAKRLVDKADRFEKKATKAAEAAAKAAEDAAKAKEKAEKSGKKQDRKAAARATSRAKRKAAVAERIAKKAKALAERAAKAVAKVDNGAPTSSPTDEKTETASSTDTDPLSGYGIIRTFDYELSPDTEMAWVVAELEDNVLPGCDEQNTCYVHMAFKETESGLQEACGRWLEDGSYGRFSMNLLPSNCQEPCVYCKLH